VIDPADYGIDNLPFGIVSDARDERRRPAVAFENGVVDLDALVRDNVLCAESLRGASTLNAFLAEGLGAWRAVRARLQHLLGPGASADERGAVAKATLSRDSVTMHLPIEVADYVDFYSSIEHATNIGRILRPTAEPLLPNYRYIPIGYHGRSGTVVVSGTPVRRPHGQRKAPDADAPSFGPSALLDVELEMGWIAGPGSTHGEPVPADAVREHVFGYVLLNDWSARDLQRWESAPLGPFNAKGFATTISSWVVSLDALEPFRCEPPTQDPIPLHYLRADQPGGFAIALEVRLRPQGSTQPTVIARSDYRHMYWTMAQQLAHHTVSGCNMSAGDLCGSGTISGPTPLSAGCLLERTLNGAQPLMLDTGETRGYLHDGDELTLAGWCQAVGYRVGFGICAGQVGPAREIAKETAGGAGKLVP